MKLSEIKNILATRDIRLTKSLGQNFLHDGNQLQRIVAAAGLNQDTKVLEIGPGLGPLTELLLLRAGRVLAIEKDDRLVKILQERFQLAVDDQSGFELIHADALEFLKQQPCDWSSWKLVSNLPYSVASPILVELALATQPPESLVATLQLEVAQRLIAQAGDDDYGILSLLVQLNFQPRSWFKIPASCFFPPPDVDSACVCLARRPQRLLSPDQQPVYVEVVKTSFSQRRKQMLKLLKNRWPGALFDRIFDSAGIALNARAETVGLSGFVEISKMVAHSHE